MRDNLQSVVTPQTTQPSGQALWYIQDGSSNCKLILKENWVQVEPGKASSLHVKESETHNGPCYQNSTCIVRIQELPTTGFEHSIYLERPAPFELLDQEGSL